MLIMNACVYNVRNFLQSMKDREVKNDYKIQRRITKQK
uniref:Transposase n=1 Tax=Heterorhabditis bacteriophora TaxID=37862 RepID=A0A1I7X2J9_HETBA